MRKEFYVNIFIFFTIKYCVKKIKFDNQLKYIKLLNIFF